MDLQGPCNQGTPGFSLSEKPFGEGSTPEPESICPSISPPIFLSIHPFYTLADLLIPHPPVHPSTHPFIHVLSTHPPNMGLPQVFCLCRSFPPEHCHLSPRALLPTMPLPRCLPWPPPANLAPYLVLATELLFMTKQDELVHPRAGSLCM